MQPFLQSIPPAAAGASAGMPTRLTGDGSIPHPYPLTVKLIPRAAVNVAICTGG